MIDRRRRAGRLPGRARAGEAAAGRADSCSSSRAERSAAIISGRSSTPTSPADDRWLVEPLIAASLGRLRRRASRAPARTLPTGYNSTRSELLDRAVRDRAAGRAVSARRRDRRRSRRTPSRWPAASASTAAAVIDARGPGRSRRARPRLAEVRRPRAAPRRAARPRPADRHGRHRRPARRLSLRLLPALRRRTDLLVEDTYYSTRPTLDRAGARRADRRLCRGAGLAHRPQSSARRRACCRWRWAATSTPSGRPRDRSARLGLRGGFFHPTTGYSLPDAVRIAVLIARQADFAGARLPMLRAEARAALARARLLPPARPDAVPRRRARRSATACCEHFYRLARP